MGIFLPNIQFLHLILLLGGLCTDDATGRRIIEGSLVDNPNEPKIAKEYKKNFE